MSVKDENGKKICACSRNRQCALHAKQMKALRMKAQETHDKEKVTVGIEALRAKYSRV